jgi:lysyl-tRNA synthetase class 1
VPESPLFWADQKAVEVVNRKFCYVDREVPDQKEYVIKTSASISGVLHIGRLSDSIRGDSVARALGDAGYNAKLIWVAEDMDPLRKIPEGVPRDYERYIGAPVVNIPDPDGCHKSYAEHHTSSYMEVFEEFVSSKITKYSMSEEYKKGSFAPYIKAMLENLEKVIEIQNKYRENPLSRGWSPFTPICANCGKIITPRLLGFDGKTASYRCEDYSFETTTAKGCGHEGEMDPLKDAGKLMWKGEWAAQWARWQVSAEGAGKEYVVPSSAWWVNAEIAEKIHGFPMPVPIFYEHIMIDGKKMSASVGNVVYPKDWLEVAPANLLRFFYNKKLMKTRSFSFSELPKLYDDYDTHARVYSGAEEIQNEKEKAHMKRLYEISQVAEPGAPSPLPFSHAYTISQIFTDEESITKSLKRSGHYADNAHDQITERLTLARNWAKKYAPDESRINLDVDMEKVKSELDESQKKFLKELANWLEESDRTSEEIHEHIYTTAKGMSIPLKGAFAAIYMAIMGTKRGPRASTFISSLDKNWVTERFKSLALPL